MYSSDCLSNSSALGCVSTASLHVHFGLLYQQSSAAMCFNGEAACTLRTVSPTEQLWDVFLRLRCMYISDCLTNRTILECFSTATLTVQFRLSHQQSNSRMFFFFFFFFFFTATQHVQFGISQQEKALGCVSTATLHVQHRLSRK